MHTGSVVSTVLISTIPFTGIAGLITIPSSTIPTITPPGMARHGLLPGTGDGDITGIAPGDGVTTACIIRITLMAGVDIPGTEAGTMVGTVGTGATAIRATGQGAIAITFATAGEQPPVRVLPEV